jgi:hypothetical protein
MSLYVLDTDSLTLFEKNHPAIMARVQTHDPRELAIKVLSDPPKRGRDSNGDARTT